MPVKKRILLERMGGGDEVLVRHLFDGFSIAGFGDRPVDFEAVYDADRPDTWPRVGVFTPAYKDELAEAWPRLRNQVFELARQWSKLRKGAVRMPFFWWIMEAGEKRDHRITEAQQLEKLGIDPIIEIFGQDDNNY